MLDSGPQSYWRLDETSGTTAASSVLANEGTDNGTYVNAVHARQPGPLAGAVLGDVGRLQRDRSYVQVPAQPRLTTARYQTVSLWFKTTAANGVLFSQSADPITGSTTANRTPRSCTSAATGSCTAGLRRHGHPAGRRPRPVNDGNWHNAVLTAAGNTRRRCTWTARRSASTVR